LATPGAGEPGAFGAGDVAGAPALGALAPAGAEAAPPPPALEAPAPRAVDTNKDSKISQSKFMTACQKGELKNVQLYRDDDYWRDRAEEALAITADIRAAERKRIMEELAATSISRDLPPSSSRLPDRDRPKKSLVIVAVRSSIDRKMELFVHWRVHLMSFSYRGRC
jgi:hypothetical protein